MHYPALFTDFYELTMMAGYFDHSMHRESAVFDLYFRTAPFEGNLAVFAGLEPALRFLENLSFSREELDYLAGLNTFKPEFIEYLAEFRFRGRVTSFLEGSVVFPGEPLVSVEGNLLEAQLVETALLNLINFQTLVATKAARLTYAARDATVIEFGLRRAQGPDGGLSVARAACIGGVRSTSNVWGAREFGIPPSGTQAHSWVMSFPDELSAFRAYARTFPDKCVLLVDTYDTLESGISNALVVARELRAQGNELIGVRIDSGDLAYLSAEARRIFDAAGFPDVKIVASNELDEHLIQTVIEDGGKVDVYGVGTRLATCAGAGGGALGGVYKLVRSGGRPRIKVTNDPAKTTLPDRKRVVRVRDENGTFLMDVMCLEGEALKSGDRVYDPRNTVRNTTVPEGAVIETVRSVVMDKGRIICDLPDLAALNARCREQLGHLPRGSLRLVNPHRYKVSISEGMLTLRTRMIREIGYHAAG